ncbi:MAG: hypothetical protein ACTHJT_17625 [Cytophaga sp.]|uniref:hypothetical protein n=1 Tax=Cytophaga sp. TaxID=29535 RepID=UPI003F7EA567
MKTSLLDNIGLLNADAEKIFNIRFGMLFSINRNRFFAYLRNYIDFYNQFRRKVLESNPAIEPASIPVLEYRNYFLSLRYQLLLIITFPLTFFIFIQHWNYIQDVKVKLHAGLMNINAVVKKPISKNSNYTPSKKKRK